MNDESGQTNNLMLMCFVFSEYHTVEQNEYNKGDYQNIMPVMAFAVLGVAFLMLYISYVSNLFV